MKILLIGNPNVGKSALFSRLTGTHIIASNYPGTTVEFTKGYLKLDSRQEEIIDVPGTYTLDPTNKAEEVAVEMLKDGDVVIDVVDATNLERNLSLTLQLIERQIPLIVALNMSDDARHRGINIDASRLEELLGVPVIPTVGTTGQGMRQLVDSIPRATIAEIKYTTGAERWTHIGSIVDEVQTLVHRHHTWRESLEDISNHPVAGVVLALFVVAAMFWIIRIIGEGIIGYITDPLFNRLWTPVLMKLSSVLGAGTFWHDILIGKLINGEVDYLQSFGLLSSGLYIPFAAVLPYLFSFYLILGLLEDIGYLPRLAVLMDTVLHRVGLHGFAIIPTVLGMGCNVPAVLATRSLESYKQRFIASTLISIAVPCASLQAMIIGLVGQKGMQYVALVYGVLFLTWVVIGLILNRFVKGFNPELLLEIPPFRMPPWSLIGKKLWMRILGFLKEALPIVLAAILVVNLLYVVGVFDFIARVTAPLISGLLGLPKESIVALVIGFLRKDVAMGMLAPLDLTAKQLVISSTVLAMSFPCVATFVVLVRELRVAGMLKATGIMIVTALVVGGLLNAIM
jgi:ferrous iron transport protein B